MTCKILKFIIVLVLWDSRESITGCRNVMLKWIGESQKQKKRTLTCDENKLYICIICQHHLLFEKQSAHSEMSRRRISQEWKPEEKDRGLLA